MNVSFANQQNLTSETSEKQGSAVLKNVLSQQPINKNDEFAFWRRPTESALPAAYARPSRQRAAIPKGALPLADPILRSSVAFRRRPIAFFL